MNQPAKSMSPTSIRPWSELPQELLGLIIDRLPGSSGDRGLLSAAWSKVQRFLLSMATPSALFREACRPSRHSASADCARFRAVCRSWKTALREHTRAPARQVPWIVMSDGYLLTLDGNDPLYGQPSLPEDATCIGSTDEWLAMDRIGAGDQQHSYFLHNPFSGTTVPLHELQTVIRRRSKFFKIHKVLMRSTPDDVIAVLTNNWNYPLILVRPGKGVWTPKPRTPPYVYIIDIAFLGDQLYGITQAYDLVSLGIAFDSNGIPGVAGIDRVIWHTPMDYHFHVWDDDEEEGEYERKMATSAEASEDDDDRRAAYELRKNSGDSMVMEATHYWLDDEEVPHGPKYLVTVSWHFVESCGKLLMVIRQLQIPEYTMKFTRKVDVFEAKVSAGGWVPVASGLDGQALFISRRFCKSIPAHGVIEGDTIYFVDTGETFNMRSQTMSPPTWDIDHRLSTWIFFSELVV